MSSHEKRLKPIKALRLLADGRLADPNSGRTFADGKEAAAFWKDRHDLIVAVDLKQFEDVPIIPPPKRGDPIRTEDGLWAALECGPMAFRSEETAAAFGKWSLAGGDRAAVRGKPFAANVDDLLKIALDADPSGLADACRSDAALRLGHALVPFLEAIPWVNPRLDASLVMSAEFVQATVLLGLRAAPAVWIRAFPAGGLEVASDDPTFDSGGRVHGSQDELGLVSHLAAHVKAVASPDEFPRLRAVAPVDIEDIVGDFRLRPVDRVVANPRRTAAAVKVPSDGTSSPEGWHRLRDARAVALWKGYERDEVLFAE